LGRHSFATVYTLMEKRAEIIPIASGKGGVGKTFLTANLAFALAEMGHQTVAVDMDLGGSNLHSFLGFSNRFPGIGDFLKARTAELEEMLVPAEAPNLQFLAGDGMTPFMANIPYAQKIRLISRIVKLPAEYILLDLGAGTSFNTLDFFRLSRHGLVITTPEYPSIMSMLAFLKHFLLRVIEGNFTTNYKIREILRLLYKQPMNSQQSIIKKVLSKIAAADADAGEIVTAVFHDYRPRLIFNMGGHPDEVKIAEQIDYTLKDVLSIEADYFGFIFDDPKIRESIKKRTAFFPNYRKGMSSESIARIAERIVRFWDRPIKNSARHVFSHAHELYSNYVSA
jgi:flagellar biosynthesis protein FlhG